MPTHRVYYICQYCEKEFTSRKSAVDHEVECKVKQENEKQVEDKKAALKERISNASSIKELETLLVEYMKSVQDVDMTVNLNVKWNESISGWMGDISGIYSNKKDCMTVSWYYTCRSIDIHTGDGGSDGINYRYEVRFLSKNFPVLAKLIEELKQIAKTKRRRKEEIDRLHGVAYTQYVLNNNELKEISNEIAELQHKIDELQSQWTKKEMIINSSHEYRESCIPSSEFDYDEDRLQLLINLTTGK